MPVEPGLDESTDPAELLVADLPALDGAISHLRALSNPGSGDSPRPTCRTGRRRCRGAPVAGAGEISVVGGRVVAISDESGHYTPPPQCLDQVMNDGLDLDGTQVRRHGD